MIQIGDSVRFLNAVGGGIVTRIDRNKQLIYVEDNDGFEIPVLERECVVVGEVNKETNFVKKDFSSRITLPTNIPTIKSDVKVKSEQTLVEIVETPGGDSLKAYLAFFASDLKQIQTTSHDLYFVNDSNYFVFYNLIIGEKGQTRSVANGIIEPNMQEELCTIAKTDLNDWENIRVQMVAYKVRKIYNIQQVVDFSLKINTVNFYKLHSFCDNDFFEEPAMLIDLCKKQDENTLLQISSEDIREALLSKTKEIKRQKTISTNNNQLLEVDLHIHELIDNISGLSNADMLQLQLSKFEQTIQENKNYKGKKIVFIHGKGEGVLRKEIEKLLKSKYKHLQFQDASFREYGFGATMVTIR